MPTPAPVTPCVLIATDNTSDAALVKDMLSREFASVQVSTDPDKALQDFERTLPGVLVFAFDSVEKAERYYLGLHRHSSVIQQHPHRTVILCSGEDLARVSALCKKRDFDDYVLFWPFNHDAPRLAMTVHLALRELTAKRADEPSAGEFAQQARRLAELEAMLSRQLSQGGHRIEDTAQAVTQAGRSINVALDGLSGRVERDDIDQHLRAATDSVQSLRAWTQDFKQDTVPHVESVRTLQAMAERVRRSVLVVDDDDFQCAMITRMLQATYQVTRADGATAAFGALRLARPDVILMDLRMPDIDGIQVTRRLKQIPSFAAIPVIMLTGIGERDAVIESRKAGACDFIVKPADSDTLHMKIARCLGAIPA